MEFFFLTQNNSVEIQIALILGLILIAMALYNLYLWIDRIRTALWISKKQLPEKISPPIQEEISIDKQKNNTVNNEQTIEFPLYIEEKKENSHIEKLVWLVSSIRTLIARGMTSEAQALIVEWLSLDKNHRDLNLLLGQIYEQDGQYEKAEYVYKDMADLHPDDIEILEKLANVLIVEKKYLIASEIYKKIHASTGNTETTLYMLTHISNTLWDKEATREYARQYILQWPKNPEIMSLLASTQVDLGLRRDAIDTYKTLKNLTPYSTEITEILQKLLIEEELSNNFEVKEG